MPTKPNAPKFTGLDSVKTINYLRANALFDYQDRIPEATQDNLRDVGKAIMSFEPARNAFVDALVNRIAFTWISSKAYMNSLRVFKKGMLEFGETIEEVFVNLLQAREFNPERAWRDVDKRYIPDLAAVFHTVNRKNYYAVSISEEQLRAAFLSPNGVSDLVTKIVSRLYDSQEFDEYSIMKELLANAIANGAMYPVTVEAPNPDNAKALVRTIKAYSNQMEFMSPKFNYMGVVTYAKKDKQVLILDTEIDALIDVEVLSSAFNMSKAEFMGRRVLVDNFGSATGVVAALVDEDWFLVFDNLFRMETRRVEIGLYWAYFYHVWQLFSVSPFANAIVFTTNSTTITAVTVTSPEGGYNQGGTYVYNAKVTGTGNFPQGVLWTVTGATDPNTYMTFDGILHVGQEETGTLTVKATSLYDSTKFGTSEISKK